MSKVFQISKELLVLMQLIMKPNVWIEKLIYLGNIVFSEDAKNKLTMTGKTTDAYDVQIKKENCKSKSRMQRLQQHETMKS